MNWVFLSAVLLAVSPAAALAQPAPANKEPLAEDVFKNVQVLKGIPVSEFMGTMGFFSASVGLNCVYCHVADSLQDWQKFAEDVPRKRIARNMIQMVNRINKENFGGRPVMTCYSCHHGYERPKGVPSLAVQYGTPDEDPNEIEVPPQPAKGPSADQILDRFVNALGNRNELSGRTTVVARGTYEGYETYHEKVPFELYAKSPAQMTTVVHTQNGDSTSVFDGRDGWVAAVNNPLPLLPLAAGAELDGARLDAELLFPAHIKEALSQWRSGFPQTTVGDSDVQPIDGVGPGKTRVKLFFDQKTGLLVRQLRYSNTIVGTNPLQIDYADYQDISGAKIPFRWTVTWTNGQSTWTIQDVRINAAIENSKFARPAPAVTAAAKTR